MASEFEFEPMTREQSKLSVAVYAPSGAGKTTAAFKLAMGIRDQLYPEESLKDIGLFVDTERRSSTKAVGRDIGGDVLEPMELYAFEPPYVLDKLFRLYQFAKTHGKKIMIVDSYTAFWSGKDGILEHVADLDVKLGAAKKMYGAWSEREIVTDKNVLKTLASDPDMHIIHCMRAKTEYVIEVNERGRNVPRAIGVKEDQQGDMRYEYDVVMSIDKDTHNVAVVKDKIGYKEIRETGENPTAPITVEDGKLLAKIVSEGLSLEERIQRKLDTYVNFCLDEKRHASSRVTAFETSKNVTLTPEYLHSLQYDQLEVLTKFLKG